MIRMFLIRFNIYRRFDLLFNTRNFDRSFIVCAPFVIARGGIYKSALKIRTTTEKYCILFEKGNMFLGVRIYVYRERGS